MPSSPSRLWRSGLLIAVFFGVAVAGAEGQAVRDWKQFPAVVETHAVRQLFALGDVHGDYEKMATLLAGAHLIEPNPATPQASKWTGGSDVIVCTGDIIDKYNHAISAITMLRTLQPQAVQAGGQFIVTMGNHEAEFLAGQGTNEKAADFEAELSAAGLDPGEVAGGKDAQGIGEWLRNLPVAAKVGDWFFCHAGNTAGMTVAQLDQQVESQVAAHGFNSPILISDDSLLEARMHPRPWWDWNGEPPSIKDEKAVKEKKRDDPTRLLTNLKALGAAHLVFGHQPGKIKFGDGTERAAGEMYEKYDGLVFLIDTGMSRGVADGRGALLHIVNGSVRDAEAVYADGSKRTLIK